METLLYIIGWLLWIAFGLFLIYAIVVVYELIYETIKHNRLKRAVLRKAVKKAKEEGY